MYSLDVAIVLRMKRSSDEIIADINPMKSSKKYSTRWQEFVDYAELNDRRPTEEDFQQYFDYLRNIKKFASSTLWSVYSMINNKFQLSFGEKLQKFPRLTMLLKSFESGYIRKTASTFTKEEILSFLKDVPNTSEYIHIKAAIVVCYYGGLRCADLVSLDVDDFEFDSHSGMWVNYTVSKQKGEQVKNKFNIPIEMCQYLEKYDNLLAQFSVSDGRFMKCFRLRKDGSGYYTKQPMGVHMLAKMTVKMATFLGLRNPSSYTGHAVK